MTLSHAIIHIHIHAIYEGIVSTRRQNYSLKFKYLHRFLKKSNSQNSGVYAKNVHPKVKKLVFNGKGNSKGMC
jgi:hypothetical protein